MPTLPVIDFAAMLQESLRGTFAIDDCPWCGDQPFDETQTITHTPTCAGVALLRRAAEEAEARAFGDRKEMEAEVERLKVEVERWQNEYEGAADAVDCRDSDGCGNCRTCNAKRFERDRAALVAAGEGVRWQHCPTITRPCMSCREWDRLAHPEKVTP